MKKLLILPLFLGGILFAQTKEDSIQFRKISSHILTKGESYNDLRDLTKNIGHRLSGSESYEKSVKWAEAKLKEAGADKVWLQEVMVPVWVRGEESLHIKTAKGKWQNIKMLSLGNSEGTGGKDLFGEILMVNSFEEFEKLSDAQVKDKIVFFNFVWRHDHVEPFKAYSEAAKYRVNAAAETAKKGGKAALIRSLSSAFDDEPHTGSMRYAENIQKVPAAAIGNTSADDLAKLLKKEKVTAKLNSNCGMKDEQLSYSVIGEITGNKDQSVIVVAGHLDSWDVGEGAHDDGSGIVQSIEVIRTFKKLGIKNNHTIRAVLYANEENGVRGGMKYYEEVKNSGEKHLFAFESDAGGFSPRGMALDMPDDKIESIKSWANLFLPYGIYDFERRGSGVDIGPLKRLGVPLSGLFPDPQRYFDIHHTHEDVFEKVNRRELLLGAAVMTQLIYMIDKNW